MEAAYQETGAARGSVLGEIMAGKWKSIRKRRRKPETWQATKERAKRSAARSREKLISDLGGCCKECGSTERLEFDHLVPRTWDRNKLNAHSRIAMYKREAAEGKIQLLCRSCNARKGEPGSEPQLDENGCIVDDFPDCPEPEAPF